MANLKKFLVPVLILGLLVCFEAANQRKKAGRKRASRKNKKLAKRPIFVLTGSDIIARNDTVIAPEGMVLKEIGTADSKLKASSARKKQKLTLRKKVKQNTSAVVKKKKAVSKTTSSAKKNALKKKKASKSRSSARKKSNISGSAVRQNLNNSSVGETDGESKSSSSKRKTSKSKSSARRKSKFPVSAARQNNSTLDSPEGGSPSSSPLIKTTKKTPKKSLSSARTNVAKSVSSAKNKGTKSTSSVRKRKKVKIFSSTDRQNPISTVLDVKEGDITSSSSVVKAGIKTATKTPRKSTQTVRKNASKSASSARKQQKISVSAARQRTNNVTLDVAEVESNENPTKKEPSVKKKAKKAPKPHIIFVVADDLGYNDVGYHTKGTGCIAHTPNINDLALNGIRLENYYTQSTCTPTRASLMTGRYPIRLGMQHGNLVCNVPRCLPLNEITLPERLNNLGYATHAVGKWHLGFASPRCLPTRRGFDSYLGILAGSADHLSYDTSCNPSSRCLYENETLAVGDKYFRHSSELYTERAIEIIRRHRKTEPLFLYLSYQAVHYPYNDIPERYLSPYMDNYPILIPRLNDTKRMAYLSLLETLDEGVGNVTEELKRVGLWDNSVLVFTSDNGGRTPIASNWPLRGRKNSLWEGGIRGVAFINSPLLPTSVIGSVHNGLMHVSDWLPTLVEGVAGDTIEGSLPLDGLNMWQSLTSGQASPRVEILHNIQRFKSDRVPEKNKLTSPIHDSWANYAQFNPLIPAGIRDGKWKLITGYQGESYSSWMPPKETFINDIPMTSVGDEEGIYIRLYDISEDPLEKHNVALYHRNIVYRLLQRLAYYNDNILVLESVSKVTRRKKVKGRPKVIPELPDVRAWIPWLP